MSIFHIANPVGPYGEVSLVPKNHKGAVHGEVEIKFCRVYNALAKDQMTMKVYFVVDDPLLITEDTVDQLIKDVRMLVCLALSGRDAPNPKHGFCVSNVEVYDQWIRSHGTV